MLIRPLIYPLMLLVGWLLAQVGRAAEPVSPRKDVQVEVNVYLVSLSESTGESFRKLANFTAPKCPCRRPSAASTTLTAEQYGHWLSLLRQDRSTCILATPRIITMSGRPAHVEVGTPFEVPGGGTKVHGLSMRLNPKADGETKPVEIDASVEFITSVPKVAFVRSVARDGEVPESEEIVLEKLESVVLDEMLTIPAGKTVACSLGKVMMEVRSEHDGYPLLAQIPYLNRFFKNVGYGREAREVFLLLTAQVTAEPSPER